MQTSITFESEFRTGVAEMLFSGSTTTRRVGGVMQDRWERETDITTEISSPTCPRIRNSLLFSAKSHSVAMNVGEKQPLTSTLPPPVAATPTPRQPSLARQFLFRLAIFYGLYRLITSDHVRRHVKMIRNDLLLS